MAKNSPEQTITTGVARLSYAHLFKPYAANRGQEPKYSTTVLIPKSDFATKQKIDAAIEAAKRTGAADRFQGVIPPILAIPVHDGDGPRPSDGLPFGPECKGNWVFTAASSHPVDVVDMGMNRIMNESEIYSGIYAHVSVTFFPYNSNGKKGIGCGLNAVMKVSDGESLAGKVSAEQAFAGLQPTQAGFQQVAPVQTAYAAQPTQAVRINPITGLPM